MSSQSLLCKSDCPLYFVDGALADRETDPQPAGGADQTVPDHLRCMLPPAGTLPTAKLFALESLIIKYADIFVGPGDAQGFTDVIRHKIDTGDAGLIKQNYFR